jgi:hypothetical protein
MSNTPGFDFSDLGGQKVAPIGSAPIPPSAPAPSRFDFSDLGGQKVTPIAAPQSAAPQPPTPKPEDTGVMASVKRNTVGAITGVYHALSDPATDQEKAEILQKVREQNSNAHNPKDLIPEDFATNPSRATLAYHRILDAPADVLSKKGHDEIEAAKDLLENHHYWRGANLYLSGLTDKVLSAVPVAGPQINSIAERGEKGDFSGAATDVASLIAAEHAPEAIKAGGKVAGKAAEAVSETANKVINKVKGTVSDVEAPAVAADQFKKAIPATKSTPYDEVDYQRSRNYLEHHHQNIEEIRNPTDVRDAADYHIKEINDKVRDAISIVPDEPISTNVIEDVKKGLAGHPKADFAEDGLKELSKYNLKNPDDRRS